MDIAVLDALLARRFKLTPPLICTTRTPRVQS